MRQPGSRPIDRDEPIDVVRQVRLENLADSTADRPHSAARRHLRRTCIEPGVAMEAWPSTADARRAGRRGRGSCRRSPDRESPSPPGVNCRTVSSGNTVSRCAARTTCGWGAAPGRSPSTLPTRSTRTFRSRQSFEKPADHRRAALFVERSERGRCTAAPVPRAGAARRARGFAAQPELRRLPAGGRPRPPPGSGGSEGSRPRTERRAPRVSPAGDRAVLHCETPSRCWSIVTPCQGVNDGAVTRDAAAFALTSRRRGESHTRGSRAA